MTLKPSQPGSRKVPGTDNLTPYEARTIYNVFKDGWPIGVIVALGQGPNAKKNWYAFVPTSDRIGVRKLEAKTSQCDGKSTKIQAMLKANGCVIKVP